MAKNTCKLCARRFASPRALAGHMRSHSLAASAAAAAAAAAAARAKKLQISSGSSASTSFTTADEDVCFKKPASIYTLRENPKKRGPDGSFSDRESEAESTPPPAKRASPPSAWGEAEPVSSLSEAATPEEDVALSLMKLSRDSWPSGARVEVDYSDDGSDDGYAPPPRPPRRPAPAPAEKRTQFQCPACKKVFRSYQALGGHRASNVRGGRGGCCAPPVAPAAPPQPLPPSPLPELQQQGVEDKQAPHECPYCYRVFASGQALGGHKRSHVCGAAAAATAQQQHQAGSVFLAPPSPIKNPGMIDLNVEPPSEEVELSAVSDPHFNSGS